MNLEPWQWVVACFGAVCIGLAKTGFPGLGLVAVACFAQIMPTKVASGFVLPLLIVGDIVGVLSFRRHVRWAFLVRLFPWTAGGVVLGTWALSRVDDLQARLLIGGIILALVGMQGWRWWKNGGARAQAAGGQSGPAISEALSPVPRSRVLAPATGLAAGFTTLVANAAGPPMTLYLLTMRLPKMEFVGTGAVFFLLLNLFKVPFMAGLGLVNPHSIGGDLLLAPAVLAGALTGRWLLPRISQRWFEAIALSMSGLSGLKLLWIW